MEVIARRNYFCRHVKESVLALFDVLPGQSHAYRCGHRNIQDDRLGKGSF
jgi:hypothetical protein